MEEINPQISEVKIESIHFDDEKTKHEDKTIDSTALDNKIILFHDNENPRKRVNLFFSFFVFVVKVANLNS